jgi:hypothetical protein
VHLTTAFRGGDQPTKETLPAIVDKYFATSEDATNRPRLLWSLYFECVAESEVNTQTIPSNVGVVRSPDSSLDYESTVESVSILPEF